MDHKSIEKLLQFVKNYAKSTKINKGIQHIHFALKFRYVSLCEKTGKKGDF